MTRERVECFTCGAPMRVVRRTIDGAGLGCPGLTLPRVQVRECDCGERDIVISAANLRRIEAALAERAALLPRRRRT